MACKKMKVLIDCDPGGDDVQALILAFGLSNLEVVAITSTQGNGPCHVTTRNLCVILRELGQSHIPLYRGAKKGFMGFELEENLEFFNKEDCMGGCLKTLEPSDHLVEALPDLPGAMAMVEMAKKYEGELIVVTTGPQTNFALAMRLDPKFTQRIKHHYIMGGNTEAKGNEDMPNAEFNFLADPEASKIVLEESSAPTTLLAWEPCLIHNFPYEQLDKWFAMTSPQAVFMEKVMRWTVERMRKIQPSGFVFCDTILIALISDPSVVKKRESYTCTTSLEGITRGQMVVDWRGVLKRERKIDLIFAVDMDRVGEMVTQALLMDDMVKKPKK